jgi:hypothetical protein
MSERGERASEGGGGGDALAGHLRKDFNVRSVARELASAQTGEDLH